MIIINLIHATLIQNDVIRALSFIPYYTGTPLSSDHHHLTVFLNTASSKNPKAVPRKITTHLCYCQC